MNFVFQKITPEQIFIELAHLSFPWWICGGWAIEMFVGNTIRDHHDMDIAILRKDHRKLRDELPNWEFKIAVDGVLHEWNETELAPHLDALWARKKGSDTWLTEFLLNESSGDKWIFRKNKTITCLLTEIGLISENNIPYLHPSIPLLFKSAHCRENDNIDFEKSLKKMNPEERIIMKNWISVFQPKCQWLNNM